MRTLRSNGDPIPAESTATKTPMDPRLMSLIQQGADDMNRVNAMEHDRLTGGYESGMVQSTEGPIDFLIGLGPQALKSIYANIFKTGFKHVAPKNISLDKAGMPESMKILKLQNNAIRQPRSMAIDEKDLSEMSDRFIRIAQAEEGYEIGKLQQQLTELLAETSGSDIKRQANNILKQVEKEDFIAKSDLRGLVDDIQNLYRQTPESLAKKGDGYPIRGGTRGLSNFVINNPLRFNNMGGRVRPF